MVIWYDILFVVNMISKKLQSKSICINTCIQQVRGILLSFENYRKEDFATSLEIAKSIALEMGVEPNHPTKRHIVRKRHFDEIGNDAGIQSAEEIFRINYVLVVVDITISSLKTRFEQLKAFENVFGFLFDSNRLKAMNDKELRDSCAKFHSTFSHDDSFDVDFNDFYSELKVLQVTLPNESMSAIDILRFVKSADCYPNVLIAYWIFLTLLVTVASAERSFQVNLFEVVNVARKVEWFGNIIH